MEPESHRHQTRNEHDPSETHSAPDWQSTRDEDMEAEELVIQLTHEDRLAFLQALLNPPPPHARLRAAVQEYMQGFGTK